MVRADHKSIVVLQATKTMIGIKDFFQDTVSTCITLTTIVCNNLSNLL